LTSLLHSEIEWWIKFASQMNGLCPCKLGVARNRITLHTDASFSGFGAACSGNFIAGTWSPRVPESELLRKIMTSPPQLHYSLANNINFLELVAACISLLVWQTNFKGCLVTVESDNTATVSFLNRATTKNTYALHWLKLVFNASVANDFRWIARHVPGLQNEQADALSRITDSQKAKQFVQNVLLPLQPRILMHRSNFSFPSVDSGEKISGTS